MPAALFIRYRHRAPALRHPKIVYRAWRINGEYVAPAHLYLWASCNYYSMQLCRNKFTALLIFTTSYTKLKIELSPTCERSCSFYGKFRALRRNTQMEVHVPAMRGKMGTRTYYACLMPLNAVPQFFRFTDWAGIGPEDREQRVLNLKR